MASEKSISALPRRRKRILILLALLLAIGCGYWFTQKNAASDTSNAEKKPWNDRAGGRNGPPGPGGPFGGPQAPVVITEAVSQDMDVFINALGTVTASTSVTVRSRVDGPLLAIHFREGQMVRKGDLLAEIDPKPFEAALAQMVGQRIRDEALLENARLDLERYQTLLAQDSIAKQEVDTQRALVKQYEGTVQTDRGAEENARLQLGYTRITAPISGRIGLSLVDPGNMINASDTTGLAVITEIQPINVIYTIPEDSLPVVLKKINTGETIPVSAWDRQLRNKLAEGTVLALDNQIDTTTGTIRIKALFKNADGILYPNQFVNIRMRTDRLEQVTTIPVAAIQRGQQGTFVYEVLENNTVKIQTVKTGYDNGEFVTITEGLQPGQRVVIDGADSLRDGMQVETVTAEMRAAATTPAPPTPRTGNQQHRKQPDTNHKPLANQTGQPIQNDTPAPPSTTAERPRRPE